MYMPYWYILGISDYYITGLFQVFVEINRLVWNQIHAMQPAIE